MFLDPATTRQLAYDRQHQLRDGALRRRSRRRDPDPDAAPPPPPAARVFRLMHVDENGESALIRRAS
jgi:hypothetical protein